DWAKTDGRVRWSYRAPTRKDFVYTGRAAYFYEPENAQVTVFESFEDSPLANAIRFLWGQGSILETFNVSACDAKCRPSEKTHTSVLLKPKEALPSVERIQLTVDGDGRVRRSVVFDPIGNRTEYRFDEVRFGTPVADKKFAFTVPDGVSIIRATGE
ncbi:MAG: outer-membrane lipoprotein carrier protein LolA, partial [Myxococcota bacterium]